MKKRIALTLALALLSSAVLSGCGKGEDVSSDANTLSYWAPMEPVLATHVRSYNEVAMYKQREADTGVHIDFIHPAIGQEGEQFNLLLTSNSMPDIIEFDWSQYSGGPQQAIEDGVIIAIDDYLEYAPNYKKAMESGDLADFYRKNSTTDDGKFYGFTTLNVGDYRIFGGPCIRRDWLKDLGLDMPETIDDWTKVLTAFKESKGAKTPLTGSGFPQSFAGGFGVGYMWYIDNGVVKYGPMQDNYKDYLATLNMWYENGLMDRDIASNQGTMVDAKITDGSAGAVSLGYIGGSLGRYMKQKETEDPNYDIVGAPYPNDAEGTNRFPIAEGDVQYSRTVAISASCKDPIAAVKWMDFWYSEDGYNLMNFGIEGESYTMVDGKPVYTDTILNNPEGLSINEALQLYCRATSPAPGFKQAPEYLEQYYAYDQQIETLKTWEGNTKYARLTMLPKLNSTQEENDKLSSINAEMNTFVDEKLWNFVTGKESIDNFDEFRNELKNQFKIDECAKILQNQYDRYNSK